MPVRVTLLVRILLGIFAISLLFVSVRRERLAYLYFSAPMDLEGTVVSAALTDTVPMATDVTRTNPEIRHVPTRLTLELAEQPGIRFQVMLPEDSAWVAPHVLAGEKVSLHVPSRWHDVLVGNRALVMGMRRGGAVLVDPAKYSYADELRTLFLGVGAALGALIAGLAAWRMGRIPRST
jgi:hypothetical protein